MPTHRRSKHLLPGLRHPLARPRRDSSAPSSSPAQCRSASGGATSKAHALRSAALAARRATSEGLCSSRSDTCGSASASTCSPGQPGMVDRDRLQVARAGTSRCQWADWAVWSPSDCEEAWTSARCAPPSQRGPDLHTECSRARTTSRVPLRWPEACFRRSQARHSLRRADPGSPTEPAVPSDISCGRVYDGRKPRMARHRVDHAGGRTDPVARQTRRPGVDRRWRHGGPNRNCEWS